MVKMVCVFVKKAKSAKKQGKDAVLCVLGFSCFFSNDDFEGRKRVFPNLQTLNDTTVKENQPDSDFLMDAINQNLQYSRKFLIEQA